MKEVTKQEYLKDKRDMRFLYCQSCKKIFKLTDYEKRNRPENGYDCPNNKGHYFYWAELCLCPIEMIELKDEIPYGRVSDDVTNEEIVADYNDIDRIYRICEKCGDIYKYRSKSEGTKCTKCGLRTLTTHSLEWIKLYRKYNQEPEMVLTKSETYYCSVEGKEAPKHKHYTLGEANAEADRLAGLSDNIGRKVHVLQLINTRTSKITIERS